MTEWRLSDYLHEEESQTRAAHAMAVVDAPTPEQALQAQRDASVLHVPASAIIRGPDFLQREAETRRTKDALRDSWRLSDWLYESPVNAGLAADDLSNLTAWEQFGETVGGPIADTAIGRAIGRGTLRLRSFGPLAQATTSQQQAEDIGRPLQSLIDEELEAVGETTDAGRAGAIERARLRYDSARSVESKGVEALKVDAARHLASAGALQKRAQAVEMSDGAAAFRDGALLTAPDTFQGVFDAFIMDPIGGAQFLVETAAEFLPVLTAAAVATATTGPMGGALTAGAGSFAIESTSETLSFLEENGVDIDDPQSAASALRNSALMAEARQRGLVRGAVIALFDAVSSGVASQTLSQIPAGEIILQGLVQSASGGLGEASAALAVGDEVSPRDVTIEALAELVTTPADLAAMRINRILETSGRARETARVFDQLDQMAEDSKVRERDPAKFREALQRTGTGNLDLHVDAEDLRTYFQAKDLPLEDLDAWGVTADALDLAAETGGTVAIPADAYAANLAGTEDAEWIRNNARLDPDALTTTEADAVNAEIGAIQLAAYQAEMEAIERGEALKSEDQRVYEGLFGELRAAGRSPQVAETEARLNTAFFRTMAERYSTADQPLSALDISEMFGLRIAPQIEADPRTRGDLDIALNTLRTQGDAALRPGGPSLAEFVAAEGGVRDLGGDLEAMDLPGGVIAETRDQATARQAQPTMDGIPVEGAGVTMDEMHRKAVEAGYLATESDVNALMEALAEEAAGRPLFLEQDQPDDDLTAIADALARAGVDLSVMDNDAAVDALEGADDIADAWTRSRGLQLPKDGTPKHQLETEAAQYSGTLNGRTLNQPKGVAYDLQLWRDRLVKLLRGDIKDDAMLRVGRTPLVLRALGAPKGQTVMRGSKVRRVSREHPEAQSALTSLPELINDPALVIDQKDKGSDFLMVTDAKASNGDPIVAAVKREGATKGGAATILLTVYDWSDGKAKAQAAARAGAIRYVRDERSVSEYELTGANSLKGSRKRPLGARSASQKILTAADVFKTQEQPGDAAPRGQIQFPAGGLRSGDSVISLFENADLSTVVHESAHFWLEAFTALASAENAPEQMRADLQTIRDYLGNDGNTWTTEQHEVWARSGESYVMEGKAPSLELGDVFARFKAWLTRLYRSLRSLDVQMSDEVREVFDRMLATDAEIALARDAQAMDPLFRDGPPPGMSAADWRAYQRLGQRAQDEAEARLLSKTMDKVRREKQRWWREERRAVEKEVADQINRQPVYRLTEMLGNRNWIGSDRDVPDLRLDETEMVDRYGAGIKVEIGRARLGGKRNIFGPDGETPEAIAEFFGFPDAGMMIEALQNAPRRKQAIADELDAVMLGRHGDPLNDGSIEEEALAAIHNEAQAMTAISEARQIAKQLGRPTRSLKQAVIRQRARLMLGQMQVRMAAKPQHFLAAERRAARRAQDAMARSLRGGDARGALSEAYQAKEQQLLNHMLYAESRKREAYVERKRRRMANYAKPKVRQKIGQGYIEQIDALLADTDLRRRSQRQVDRSESLRAFVDRMIAEGREDQIAIDDRLIDESRRQHYTRMTMDEFEGLVETVENLEHLGRTKQKLINRQAERDFEETLQAVAGGAGANLTGAPPGRTDSAGERLRRAGSDFLNLTMTADTHLRKADGWEDLGPVWTNIKQPIDEGMARLVQRRQEIGEKLEEFFSEYSAGERSDLGRRRDVPELRESLTKLNLLVMAMNTGNEGNFTRLTNPDVQGAYPSDMVRDALSNHLDDRDWRVVQSVWDYFEEYAPEIREKEKRTTGVSPKMVERKPMVDAPAFVTGGYFPIAYDRRLTSMVDEKESIDLAKMQRAGRAAKAQTRNGHAKERQQNVREPLALEFGIVTQHLNSVVYDLEIGEAVNNSYRILTNERVKNAWRQAGQETDHNALEVWLKDIAMGDRVSARGWNAVRWLRTGFVTSRLALNVSTALIQPTGLAQSAALIGKRAVARASFNWFTKPHLMTPRTDDVVGRSKFMRDRQLTFQRDIYDILGDVETGLPGRYGRFMRDVLYPMSFWMMQKVQFYTVDMPTWMAAFDVEMARSGDEGKAATHADQMVRRAQGSGLLSDRGMLERGTVFDHVRQSEVPKLFTALGSYMFAKGNVAYEVTARTNFRDPVEALKWASDMVLLFTFEALIYSAVKGFLPDPDEDDDETMAEWLAWETLYSAMSTVPIGREVAGGFQGFGGGGILQGVLEGAFIRPAEQMAQEEFDRALVRSIVNSTGIFLHLPSSMANNVINGLYERDMTLRDDPSVPAMIGVGGEGRTSLAEYLFDD